MKLYVGNLPSSTTVRDLQDLFTPYGDVSSARLLMTDQGGYPRAFGYVEMLSQNAERAIAELHGQRLNLMVLSVAEAEG